MISEEIKNKMKPIIEAAIFSAGEPLNLERLLQLFAEDEQSNKDDLQQLLQEMAESYQERGVELVEVASGYRFQAKPQYAASLQKLWEKKPARYTRAFLETLALIIYHQPVTRGEIEEIRGVTVGSNIIKTLLEHEWIKIVGYKDVPGKPAIFGSTQQFLDYFNLKNLNELPPMQELLSVEQIEEKFGMQVEEEPQLSLVMEPTEMLEHASAD